MTAFFSFRNTNRIATWSQPRHMPPTPHTLGRPTVINPMTLPLIEQRTLRTRLVAVRTRVEPRFFPVQGWDPSLTFDSSEFAFPDYSRRLGAHRPNNILTVGGDFQMAAWATLFVPWVAPNESETYYGRLPWLDAEAKLSETAPVPPAYRATATWHGDLLDKETGAFVLVKTGGTLSGLVGKRLKVTATAQGKKRSVTVYCKGITDQITDDLSLTRRAFTGIAVLSSTNVTVQVEVLS